MLKKKKKKSFTYNIEVKKKNFNITNKKHNKTIFQWSQTIKKKVKNKHEQY